MAARGVLMVTGKVLVKTTCLACVAGGIVFAGVRSHHSGGKAARNLRGELRRREKIPKLFLPILHTVPKLPC